MSKNNIWYFSMLSLATFGIILCPAVLSYILWSIIMIIVCVLTATSARNLEKRFNLMVLVMIVAITIGIYISTEYPYKRNVQEKIYVPNNLIIGYFQKRL